MSKTYKFGLDNKVVIEKDEETGQEWFIPYTTDINDHMVQGNIDFQRISKAFSKGEIVIEPYVAPVFAEPEVTTVDKIWFIRALRQLNLKAGFDTALGAMSEDYQEDFSLMTTIDKADPIVKTWVKSAKIKAKNLDEVFTTADSLKKAS